VLAYIVGVTAKINLVLLFVAESWQEAPEAYMVAVLPQLSKPHHIHNSGNDNQGRPDYSESQ
jgi:hypothetical protein